MEKKEKDKITNNYKSDSEKSGEISGLCDSKKETEKFDVADKIEDIIFCT